MKQSGDQTGGQAGRLSGFARRAAISVFTVGVTLFARFVTAVLGIWVDNKPSRKRRIYFANHASHGDFILIWIGAAAAAAQADAARRRLRLLAEVPAAAFHRHATCSTPF